MVRTDLEVYTSLLLGMTVVQFLKNWYISLDFDLIVSAVSCRCVLILTLLRLLYLVI